MQEYNSSVRIQANTRTECRFVTMVMLRVNEVTFCVLFLYTK